MIEWTKVSENLPKKPGDYLTWSPMFRAPRVLEYPPEEYECPIVGKNNTWKGPTHWAEIPLPDDET